MKRIIILCHILMGPFWLLGQSCGLEDTILINPNSTQTFQLQISDYFNDNLADPAQGVCGIELYFLHQFIDNLEISVTSPGGDIVHLIGPNTEEQFAFTFFSRWNITFVPCAEAAMPDSGYVAQWTNDQPANFASGFFYDGTYYPYDGCLEDFDSGPVNGNWTFTIHNNPSAYAGAILFARIIFCDSRGVDCCFAKAGSLLQNDVLACQGDSALNLTLPPTLVGLRPDTSEYDYTYLISRNDVLVEIDTLPDLRTYVAGTYEVCGLSYRRDQLDSLPVPDNVLTIDSLRRNLDGFFADFCGNISDSCVLVTIAPPLPPTDLTISICAGESYAVGDSTFDESGVYAVSLQGFAGCDSLVNLNLTVVPDTTIELIETICRGDTIYVGGVPYFNNGTYTNHLHTAIGCDSTVVLNLTVLEVAEETLTVTICRGESYTAGTTVFTNPGNYDIPLENMAASGCDSLLHLTLNVIDIQAIIAAPGAITCFNNGVTLDGNGSLPAGAVSFNWTDGAGNMLGADPTLFVDAAGAYILNVEFAGNGAHCFAADTVVIVDNRIFPIADAGLPGTLTCAVTQANIGGAATSAGPEFQYQWEITSPGGNFSGPTNTRTTTVDVPGTYRLIVINTVTGCRDSSSVVIGADQFSPIANAGPDTSLTCIRQFVILNGNGSSTGSNFVYEWVSTTGIVPQNATTRTPTVTVAGQYRLIVRNTTNECRDTAFVQVVADTLSPHAAISVPAPGRLDCETRSLTLDATASDSGIDYPLIWTTGNGGHIASGENSLTPVIDAAGNYQLVVINALTGCRDTARVAIADTTNLIVAQISGPDTITCNVPTAILSPAGSTTGINMVYEWFSPDGIYAAGPGANEITASTGGLYRLIARDTFTECVDTAYLIVASQNAPPLVEAGQGFVLDCEVVEGTLDGSLSEQSPELAYLWTGPCIQSPADALQITVDCAGLYQLEVRNLENGCSATDTVRVTQSSALPVVSVATPLVLNCLNNTVILDGSASSPADSLHFQWFGAGLDDSDTTQTVVVSEPGFYSLAVNNPYTQCADTLTVEVLRDVVIPVADAGPDTTLTCLRDTVVLCGPGTSAGPRIVYDWFTSEGHIVGTDDAPCITVDSAGVYVLFVTDTLNGCADTALVSVSSDQAPPFVNAGQDVQIDCANDMVTLTGNVTATHTAAISWSGICVLSPPDALSIHVNCAGQYILTATDEVNGCSRSDTVTISLSPAAPLAFTADTTAISCETGVATINTAGTTAGFYQWYFNDELTTITTLNPVVNEAGTYLLVVSNLDQSCTDSATAIVTLDCTPSAIIAAPDTITCGRELVQLNGSASSSGMPFTYLWIEPEAGCIFDGQGTTSPRVRCAGEYALVVTNDVVNLSDTAFVTVVVDTLRPIAQAALPDTITCDFREVLLEAGTSSSGDNIVYVWTSINSDTLSTMPTAIADLPGTYLLEVYDSDNGCRAVDFVQVFQRDVIPRIIFPNTIFPCLQDSFRLESFVDPPEASFSYEWSGDGIMSNTDSAFVWVSGPGTYILTVTELVGNCTTVDTAIVMEQNCVPCLNLDEPASLTCTNGTAVLEASFCELCTGCTLQWSTSGGGVILSGDQTLTPLVGAAGTYTLVATDTLGFQSTLEVTVSAATDPIADAGPDRLITCDSVLVTLGSLYKPVDDDIVYAWTAFGPGMPSPDNERFTTVDVPDTYVLEVFNTQTGCFARDTVVVGTDFTTPTAEAGSGGNLTCNQNLLVLDGTGSTLGANITYAWTTDMADCITGGATLNPIVDCPGIYRLTVRNTSTGCTDTDSVTVNFAGVMPPLLTIPDTSLTCIRTSVTLVGNAPDATGYTPQWCALDAGNNVIPNSCTNELELDVTQPGNYQFTLQNDTTGCRAVAVILVSDQRQIPEVDAGAAATLFCTQDSLILQGAADPGLIYEWSAVGGSNIANANTLTPTIYAADTFILKVTHPLTQCMAADTVVILQDVNAPSSDAGLPDTLNCADNTLVLSGEAATASGSMVLQWTTSGGNIISDPTLPSITVDRGGRYYFLVRDPANNCTAIDSVMIDEDRRLPSIDNLELSGLQLTCALDTITFDASNAVSGTGMPLTYQWEVVALGHLIGDVTSPVVQADQVGAYRLIVTDASNSCSVAFPFSLGADRDEPTATVAPPAPLGCASLQTTLDGTGSSSGPEFRYEWRNPDGILLPQIGLVISVAQPGDYTLTVINTENGCEKSATVTVIEDRTLPIAIAEADGLLDCETQEVMLDGQNSSAGPSYTYLWSTDAGILLSPADQISVMAGAAGAYVLTVRDSRNQCEAKDTVIAGATGNFIIGASLALLPPTCDGQNGGTVTVESVQGGTAPFLFALNSDIFTATQNFRFLLPGEYLLQVEDANGCTWDTLLTMPELLPPVVDLGPDILLHPGDTIQLEALVNVPYESLHWSPAEAFADPSLPVQRVSPSETVAYSVVVRDEFGCQGSDYVLITVDTPVPVFIPNIFSPNGDGQNDVLLIFAGNAVQSIAVFSIFDRWGNQVFGQKNFQPNDPVFGWDGNFENRPMNSAVYAYYAEVAMKDGSVVVLKGDVVLMR